MFEQNSPKPLDQLNMLLDRERRALLSGKLDTLTHVLQQKEGLLDQIVQSPMHVSAQDISSLRTKLDRNQRLLAIALDGLRDVAKRINELRRVQNSLETYDCQGRRALSHAPSTHRFEKRA